MSWALIGSGFSFGSSDGNGFTLSGLNLSGGNFIGLAVVSYTGAATPTISDGVNTYSYRTLRDTGSAMKVRLAYAYNATCTGSQSIVVSGSGNFCAIAGAAFSGGLTTDPYDGQEAGTTIGTWNSLPAGSITPVNNDSLVLAALGFGPDDTIAATSPLNTPITVHFSGGLHYGVSFSYVIQSGAPSAINATFTSTGGTSAGAIASASFQVGGAGGSSEPLFRPPNMAGLGAGGQFFSNPLS